MSPETIVAMVGGFVVILSLVVLGTKKLPKKLKSSHYTRKWREIQKLCADKNEWSNAVIRADNLLDEILKKRRFNGKSTGERLVEAQKKLTTNDAVWNAHKIATKLKQKSTLALKEDDVKNALIAFRQALRDLGAL